MTLSPVVSKMHQEKFSHTFSGVAKVSQFFYIYRSQNPHMFADTLVF